MVVTCSLVLRTLVPALALFAATAAHAVVYKWVEEDDKVIYSNEPPPDPGKVRELTRIDDLELVPVDIRPQDRTATEQETLGGAGAVAAPMAAPPPPPEPVTLTPREPVTLIPREPVTLIPREPVTLLPREPVALPREAEPPPRVIPRSTHTGPVQDPCLTSPDPRCHERNKGNYHPYLGYSPSNGPVPQAVGASGGGAGGTVGGQVPAAQAAAAPPKRGAQALPSGSAAPVAIEWIKPVR